MRLSVCVSSRSVMDPPAAPGQVRAPAEPRGAGRVRTAWIHQRRWVGRQRAREPAVPAPISPPDGGGRQLVSRGGAF